MYANFFLVTEPQAKASVHIEEVPKDLEEQVEELHAQVFIEAIFICSQCRCDKSQMNKEIIVIRRCE